MNGKKTQPPQIHSYIETGLRDNPNGPFRIFCCHRRRRRRQYSVFISRVHLFGFILFYFIWMYAFWAVFFIGLRSFEQCLSEIIWIRSVCSVFSFDGYHFSVLFSLGQPNRLVRIFFAFLF